MAVSLIEKIASIVEGALIRHGVTEFEGTLDDAQAALTAIMDAGDGVQECDREASIELYGELETLLHYHEREAITEAFARHRSTAAAAERARMGWQPIETAPKSWDDVLVFSPQHEGFNCGGVFLAFYDPEEKAWGTHAPGGVLAINPTHWMPLPAPPADAIERGEV